MSKYASVDNKITPQMMVSIQAAASLATSKQDTLQSGVNIKTFNSESILGSGNIAAGGLTQAQILTRQL